MAVLRDPAKIEGYRRTNYPAELAEGFGGRLKRALGDAGALTQFGVNLTTLEPGAASAHRHWHTREDEFVYIIEGEITLVTDDGEETLSPGMAVAFPAGEENAHQLINRSRGPATYLEVGTRAPDDDVVYADVDMRMEKRGGRRKYVRKSGEPYE
jgi:uncharacterized cupin superfamily protein